MARYHVLAWREEGKWVAQCPSLPGVYGMGPTCKRAMADFSEAAATLRDYLAEIGEPLPKRVEVRVEKLDL